MKYAATPARVMKPPIIVNTGCSVKMTVELATEVNFRDSIQNKKWSARNSPEETRRIKSLLFNYTDPKRWALIPAWSRIL